MPFLALFFSPVSMVERWSFAKRKAYEWSAWVEVTFGVILIVELILPRRLVGKLLGGAGIRVPQK